MEIWKTDEFTHIAQSLLIWIIIEYVRNVIKRLIMFKYLQHIVQYDI